MDQVIDYDTFEVKFKLIAILHGSIDNCNNAVYPALYNRIAAPDNYPWIMDTIFGNSSFFYHIFLLILSVWSKDLKI